MSIYEKRGVSAGKEEVHAAVEGMDAGLFPTAFCKILPDFATGDPDYCALMHADTAGTKTSLAYLYWRETGDVSVWAGIAQDAIVMNVDDMACVGLTENIALSSTIGRNKHLITGEVIGALIRANADFVERMRALGIPMLLAGGETADVGDVVRTVDVGITAYGRMRRRDVVTIDPRPGDLIVGFGGYGRATYEREYNSGIGSNGLTGARHDLLRHAYAKTYPETFDPNTDDAYVYTGPHAVTDALDIEGHGEIAIGKLLLSPTRTFLPLLHRLVPALGDRLRGLVHNTGGAASKVGKFVSGIRVIKDELLPLPPLFAHIANVNEMTPRELYQVYNMGTRLEAYVTEEGVATCLEAAAAFDIPAQVIGRVEAGEPEVTVRTHAGEWVSYGVG